MKRSLLPLRGLAALAFLPLTLQAQTPRTIGSITDPGDALAVRGASLHTGLVTFAGAPGRGIELKTPSGASAEARAMHFVDLYGKAFGIAGSTQVRMMRASAPDAAGIEHVLLQQVHRGVPVRGGELVVHMKGTRVVVANGHAANDLPDDVVPRITAGIARADAQRLLEKHDPKAATGATYSDPRLEIFNRGLLSEAGKHRSRLAWFIEARSVGVRQFIWIDAQTGALLLEFNQLAHARNRLVYTAGHTNALPGTLVRSEGGAATGDADQDNAYTFSGATYDYYLANHGRDSYDGAGATIVSTTQYCEPGTCPSYANAFWDGAQMVYGDGFASADDVVGHELTHAVTEKTANLFYWNQSGALNESFSDIFGETIDLTDQLGTDTANVRWLVGEDLATGAIRNMMDPTAAVDPAPGKMSDPQFICEADGWNYGDSGGVHTNSGIPNHAYALMVDGGTYNGRTITGIGLTKAAQIQYRALTRYLTSGANFIDGYNALNQSCTDLVGTSGIVAGDCTAVNEALLAVEMNAPSPCPNAVEAPPLCPSGVPSYIRFDGFESGAGNWTENNASGQWGVTTGAAKEGLFSEWGEDVGAISDHQLTLTNAVSLPPNARFHFDHLYEFENAGTSAYDGGVVEYSTDGTTWLDAGGLIDAGHLYGTSPVYCCFGNPLAGRTAFVKSSFGYTGTRLDLASLSGQSVKLRFRVGTDDSIGSLGWVIDNAALYTCVSSAFTDDPITVSSTVIKRVHITELRARIDSLRIRNGLATFSWTDPTITAGLTPVKAAHMTDLRTAIGQVYTAAGVTPPTFTDPALAAGTRVKKVHVDELRIAVLALE